MNSTTLELRTAVCSKTNPPKKGVKRLGEDNCDAYLKPRTLLQNIEGTPTNQQEKEK